MKIWPRSEQAQKLMKISVTMAFWVAKKSLRATKPTVCPTEVKTMLAEESRAGAPKGQKETNQGVKEALGRILEDGRGKSAGGLAKSHFSVLVSCGGGSSESRPNICDVSRV